MGGAERCRTCRACSRGRTLEAGVHDPRSRRLHRRRPRGRRPAGTVWRSPAREAGFAPHAAEEELRMSDLVFAAPPRSGENIENLADAVRKMFGLADEPFFPIVPFVEKGLPYIVDGLTFDVVE